MSDKEPTATHPRPHPDLAAWILGACEPEEAEAFKEHLDSCAECQAELEELEGLPDRIGEAAPPAELPPGLEARTLGAVRLAAMRQRRRRVRSVVWSAAASVVLLAVLSVGVLLQSDAPQFVWQLSPTGETTGVAASAQGEAKAWRTDGGSWVVELEAAGLPSTGTDAYYACYYVGADDSPDQPDRVLAGSFRPDPDGTATVRMAVFAADPNRFPEMEIVLEAVGGDPSTPGTVVLTGKGEPA
jgi:hypothetical protein